MLLRFARRPVVTWRIDSRCCTQARVFSSSGHDGEPKGTPYSELTVGIPKEIYPLEKRVAATPESVGHMVKPGFNVIVEEGAGESAYFNNSSYEASGAKVVSKDALWKESDIILKVSHDLVWCLSYCDGTLIVGFASRLDSSSVIGGSGSFGGSYYYFVLVAESKQGHRKSVAETGCHGLCHGLYSPDLESWTNVRRPE